MHRIQSGGWPYPYGRHKHFTNIIALYPGILHMRTKILGWKVSEKESWTGPGNKATNIKCLFHGLSGALHLPHRLDKWLDLVRTQTVLLLTLRLTPQNIFPLKV